MTVSPHIIIFLLLLFQSPIYVSSFDVTYNLTLKELLDIQQDISCITSNGTWIELESAEDVAIYNHSCTDLRYIQGACSQVRQLPGAKFFWKPRCASYEYKKFSKIEMCRMIIDLNILFVGDSLQEEMFITFMSALRNMPGCIVQGHGNDGKVQESVPCSNANISSLRHDEAWMEGGNEANFSMSNVHWSSLIAEQNISILVINRGAHYKPDSIVLDSLAHTFRTLEARHPHLLIVYRSTGPAHFDCKNYFDSKPLKSYTLPKVLYNDSSYHWTQFNRQNLKVKTMIANYFPRVIYLDVYTSTVLRADSHCVTESDCLHYCIPGPIDNWVTLLFNALLLRFRRIPNFLYRRRIR